MTRFFISTVALILTAVTVFGQRSENIKPKLLGKWTMASSISKKKNECKIYYTAYTLTFDKGGNYFLCVTSTSDNSTITESGKYEIDNSTNTMYFFDIKLTVPGQNATMGNYQFIILKADIDKLVFRQCLCDVDETDSNFDQNINCKTTYTKTK